MKNQVTSVLFSTLDLFYWRDLYDGLQKNRPKRTEEYYYHSTKQYSNIIIF